MKNTLLLLALFLFTNLSSKAQDFVDVGEGTNTTSNPIFASWKYAWTSFLYTSEELGEARVIDKIAYYAGVNTLGTQHVFENQKIYFHITTANTVDRTYPDMATDTYSKVFEGAVSYPIDGAGWIILDIDNFDYDGTSNLIIHYQNNSGYSTYTSNMFLSTTVDITMGASIGDDSAFPEGVDGYNNNNRPDVRLYSPLDPNTPGTPVLVSPTNSMTKVAIETQMEFSIVNAEKYDVFFGKDGNALEKVESDVVVTEDGNYTYSPNADLDSKTTYYMKIVAHKGEVSSESSVFSFTTEKVISSLPFICGFEESYEYSNGWSTSITNKIIDTAFPTSSEWTYDKNWNSEQDPYQNSGDWAGVVSSGSIGDFSLTTPRFSITEDCYVSFYWKNGYINYGKEPASTYLEISTDGGANWEQLAEMKADEKMKSYRFEKVFLNNKTGDDIYFRWRHHQHQASSYNYFHIDDIKVDIATSGPEAIMEENSIEFGEISTNGVSTQTFNVRNVGNEDLVITESNSAGPYSCDFIGTIPSGASQELTVKFNPANAGTFDSDLIFDCNMLANSFSVNISGSAYEPMSEFEEVFSTAALPYQWSAINSTTDYSTKAVIGFLYFDAHSGFYAASVSRGTDLESPVFLITPGVKDFDINALSFYAKKASDATYDLSLDVGVMTNVSDPSTFKLVQTVDLTTENQQYSVEFDAEETAPYICFRHNTMVANTSIFMDDIVWGEKISTSSDIESENFAELNVYPNPTSGVVNINTPKVNNSIAKVYNQLGSVVFSMKLSKTVEKVDLSFLPTGWYCMVVQTEESTYKKVFIKK